MKRLVLAVTLSFTMISVSASAALAADYYVGTSNTTGMECYLMTHTVTELRRYSDGGRFSARLKMVGRTVQYLDYELDIGTSGFMFKNSEGYWGEVTRRSTPIEWNMCQYIARNFL